MSAAGPLISQIAYTTGTTRLASDVAAEMPAWAAAEPKVTAIVASVQPHSALATPLLAGGRPLGVILFGRGRGRPRFATADAEVVEEIARRLAVGLANTNTFAREHAIAETLQRSILPDTLPQIQGLDLAVRYLPGTEGVPDTLASVVYAVLDLATGDLVYASAGHPPPIYITGDGHARYLDDTDGIMLGASADARFSTGVRRLSAGTSVLCYTDGLIESRQRDISEGLDLLAEAVRYPAPGSAEQLCATAQAALLGTAARADDVCLLAARLTG